MTSAASCIDSTSPNCRLEQVQNMMFQNDFNYGILEETSHRPWPMPDSAWVMTQTWHDLLFAHWPVDKQLLRSKVPVGVELDLYENRAWIGVVPFRMTNVAPRGVPALPWVSAFPELNVRTYVTVGGKPGVYFFSLDAGNPLAVAAARTMFHLPYFSATMQVEEQGGWVHYSSRRAGSGEARAQLVGKYRPTEPVKLAEVGSLEHFLTERYCLYTFDASRHLYRLEIHHPPWPLQAAEAQFEVNTMTDGGGIRLPDMAPLLHFAKRQDVVAWPMQSLAES
jgi:uncharacterized protein YqjF (DUF2071 family)